MQIYSTQAFTENCIVCRSHRSDVGFEAGVDDVPEVLLAGPELRCLGWLLEVVDDEDEGCAGDGLAGWDELLVVIGSTTRPGSMYFW